MKRILLSVLVLLSALTCSAVVNKEKMEVAYTAKTAGKVDFTVLNKANDKGFVILDNQDQVLGYSDAGKFDYDKMPDNFKWWLSQYQEQINFARTNNIKVVPVRALSDSDSIIVQPLLGDTEWDQGSPYCNYCPPDGRYQSIVGCVATAMSQIMYYYQWPLKGHGYHQYDWRGNKLSRNFSESTYDWGNMLPKYRNGQYTSAQANAVARICSDAGISVDMDYSASASGTSSTVISPALIGYFGYSAKTHLLSQNNMPKAKWDSIIVAELDASRPVLYCGQDNSSGGHAFVCDGYTKEGFFHFNWGWSGSGNGYFKTGALNVQGYKFNFSNDITIGIEPRTTVIADELCYEIMSDSTVVLTYKDDSEYTGPVVVPEEITIDSVTYKVSGLAYGCLSELSKIPSVQVPWTTPLKNAEKMFGNYVYENTVLIVPDNCVEIYANSPGWNKFKCIKDTIGHSIEWGEWESFVDGVGTYIYSVNYAFAKDQKDPGLPISYRGSKNKDGKGQFRVQHWSYDTDLYISYDSVTGNCVIPKQYAGYEVIIDGVESAPVYISDVPSFSSKYSYKDYPCKYDAKRGLFTLNILYLCGGENDDAYQIQGVETFQVDGFDSSMSATYDYEKTFGKKIGVKITAASMIKSCKYVFVEGEISEDSAAVVARQIADSLIESKSAYIGTTTYKPAAIDKTYTMVIVGFNKNGAYCNHTSTILNYNDIYNMNLGDANKDNDIDVSDITTTAAYILGEKPANFNRFSADIDNDGVITVADITAIATMILEGK